jgi:hypothetical protein
MSAKRGKNSQKARLVNRNRERYRGPAIVLWRRRFFVVKFRCNGNTAMHIDIPITEAKKLERHATAAGFDSVEKYVTEFVLTLAERPDALELFAPMIDDELAASLAMIDRGMEEIKAGRTTTAKEALQGMADEFGLKIKQ